MKSYQSLKLFRIFIYLHSAVFFTTITTASADELFDHLNIHQLFESRITSPPLIPSQYKKIHVQNSHELYAAIANNKQGNVVIFLKEGEYSIPKTLNITANNIMMLGNYQYPKNVVLTGNGMKHTSDVDNLIRVSGDNFHIEGITLQQAGNHLIQLADGDSPTIKNVIFRDGYEQLLKVSHDKKYPEKYSSKGLVENNLFYYSAGIGPNFYIGGIDAHAIESWLIKGNIFKGIASPSGHIAEHAIHIWNNSKNNVVKNNIIIDSDRAIGFGMRIKKGNPNNIYNYGGEISDNIIYHSNNNHLFADVAIIVEDSPKTVIKNNLVYSRHSYPYSMEFRYPSSTSLLIENNIVNRGIRPRDNADIYLKHNIVTADNVIMTQDLKEKLASWAQDPN